MTVQRACLTSVHQCALSKSIVSENYEHVYYFGRMQTIIGVFEAGQRGFAPPKSFLAP